MDGISATVLGVLTALVIADLTGGTGRSTWLRALLEQRPALAPQSAQHYQAGRREARLERGIFVYRRHRADRNTHDLVSMPETKRQTERSEKHGQLVGHTYVENADSAMERNMAFKVQVGPPQISIHQGQRY